MDIRFQDLQTSIVASETGGAVHRTGSFRKAADKGLELDDRQPHEKAGLPPVH